MLLTDISVKDWRNLPINNPKSELHNSDAYTKFGENPSIFTQVIIRKQKYGQTDGHTTDRLMDIQTANLKP